MLPHRRYLPEEEVEILSWWLDLGGLYILHLLRYSQVLSHSLGSIVALWITCRRDFDYTWFERFVVRTPYSSSPWWNMRDPYLLVFQDCLQMFFVRHLYCWRSFCILLRIFGFRFFLLCLFFHRCQDVFLRLFLQVGHDNLVIDLYLLYSLSWFCIWGWHLSLQKWSHARSAESLMQKVVHHRWWTWISQISLWWISWKSDCLFDICLCFG